MDLNNWLVFPLHYLEKSFFSFFIFFQEYNVYYGNSSTGTITDLIKRDVYFTRPVFTNKFRIVVKESADVISMTLKILGQTASDQYSANPNMELRETFQSETVFPELKVSQPNMFFLSRHICPGGKMEFSGVLIEDPEHYTSWPYGKTSENIIKTQFLIVILQFQLCF